MCASYQWAYKYRLKILPDQGNGWAVPANATQLAVIDAVAAHYPGVHGGPPPPAEKALLDSLSKPMFAAEDGAAPGAT